MPDDSINSILIDALWTLGVVGMVLAIAAGLMLVASPSAALRLGNRLNREFSIAWLKDLLDEPRNAEPWIYRHHRAVGVLLLLATLFFFWNFATTYDTGVLVEIFEGSVPTVVLEILASVVTTVLVLGNGLGFALGVVMLVRPSALKRTEALANRWVDTNAAAESLDRRVNQPESLARRYPRRIGAVILLATAYVALIAIVVAI